MNAQRGAALILVLWFSVGLSLIVVDLTVVTRDLALRVANTKSAIQARAALSAASHLAIELLIRGDFDSSGQAIWQFDGTTITARVEPESGKIDLNGASQELIEGLVKAIIEDEDTALELAHAILDWRDPNDLRRSHGAEKSDYRIEGLDYAPADRAFRHVRDLDAVLGMNRETYLALAPHLTIATGSSAPDELRASEISLEALDIARGLQVLREGEGELDEATGELDEETESDDDEFSLDSEEEVEEQVDLTLFDDPAGIYTLDLQAQLESGFLERSRTLIWIGAPVGTSDYLVLQHEGGLLPWKPPVKVIP